MPRDNPVLELLTTLGGTILAAFALIAAAIAVHLIRWIAAGGKHVSVAWTGDGLPPLSPGEASAAQKLRTRDPSNLRHRPGCNCSLLFWKIDSSPGLDSRLVNLMAGFNGVAHVSVDCCVSDSNGSWVIESDAAGSVDGPHYVPVTFWRGRMRARVDISALIDCEMLYRDLAGIIADPRVRQKGIRHWADFSLGRTDPHTVTCSELIGRCILRQPSSSLATVLRQAMKERLTYGEIAPNDLARAVAILQAGRQEAQFTQTPVLRALWNALRSFRRHR